MADIETWAESIQREMFSFWKNHLGDAHRQGFEVFTSPVSPDASIIFLGYNPGTRYDEEKLAENDEYHPHMEEYHLQVDDEGASLPTAHDYAPNGGNHPVAKFIRNHLFDGREHYLSESIETNRYYLRTNTSGDHRELDEKVGAAWDDYIVFCRKADAELIQRVNPDLIVAFGIETWDSLNADGRYTLQKRDEFDRASGNSRLAIDAQLDDHPLLVLHHPSYLRGTEDDEEKTQNVLGPLLDTYLQ